MIPPTRYQTRNLREIIYIPVVHQDIWLPEVVRRNSDIFHIVVLRYIPPHVAVRPFLMSEIDLYNIRGNTNILKVSFGNKEEASIFIALIVWVSTLMCFIGWINLCHESSQITLLFGICPVPGK